MPDGEQLDLPDVELQDPETAWRVWRVLRFVEFRWTILDVLEQPEALLADVMAIQFAFRRHQENKPKPVRVPARGD